MTDSINYYNKHEIGDIGEAYAIAKFSYYGLKVSKPLTLNLPYDLIVDNRGTLYKIQVKTTERPKNGVMMFKLNRTNPFTYAKHRYKPNEIDFMFLFCIENEWCGLLDSNEFSAYTIAIRENDDWKYKSKHASDYCFDKRVFELFSNIHLKKNGLSQHNATHQISTNLDYTISEIPGRTTRDELKKDIRTMSFVSIGKKYGVTDNAIRKWCRRMGLPSKVSIIEKLSDEEWNNV